MYNLGIALAYRSSKPPIEATTTKLFQRQLRRHSWSASTGGGFSQKRRMGIRWKGKRREFVEELAKSGLWYLQCRLSCITNEPDFSRPTQYNSSFARRSVPETSDIPHAALILLPNYDRFPVSKRLRILVIVLAQSHPVQSGFVEPCLRATGAASLGDRTLSVGAFPKPIELSFESMIARRWLTSSRMGSRFDANVAYTRASRSRALYARSRALYD
jgi:hypothetical protein